jgi:hypothetical protein
MLAFLATLFVAEIILVSVAAAEMAYTMQGTPPIRPITWMPRWMGPVTVEPFSGIHACTLVAMDVSPYFFYFPVLTFELALFSLTVWIFIKRYKALRQILVGRSRATLLVNVLIFGNMYYFF